MTDSDFLVTPVIGGLIGAWITWSSKPTPKPLTVPVKSSSDLDALGSLAELMEAGIRYDAFYDVSLLPYPKRRLMAAAESVFLSSETLDEYCQFLIVALHVLPLFRVGIGPKPLYWFGDEMTLTKQLDTADPLCRHEIRQLATHNEIWWPVVERLQADAKREQEQIDQRIEVLKHLRTTRSEWQKAAEFKADLTPPPLVAEPQAKTTAIGKVVADFGLCTENQVLVSVR